MEKPRIRFDNESSIPLSNYVGYLPTHKCVQPAADTTLPSPLSNNAGYLLNFFVPACLQFNKLLNQLLCRWVHCLMFQLHVAQMAEALYRPCIKYRGVGGWARISHLAGCIKMNYIDHLDEETKMLTVQDLLLLICSQYLARALQSNNPSHSVVTFPSGIRSQKKTSISVYPSCCSVSIERYSINLWYGTTIKSLHTKAVSDSKSLLTSNPVLQTASP